MSSKQSGAGTIKFDYLEEFDSIFGSEPNITSPVTASSLPHSKMYENKETDEQQLLEFNSNVKAKEEGRNKRHQERLERQDKALEILEKIANFFKEVSGN